MRVLITGATGFIGSQLAILLKIRGYEVSALARKNSRTDSLVDEGIEIIEGDLTDPNSLKKAVSNTQKIIHLGAYYTFFGKKELYKLINVEGTRALSEAALEAGIDHFIYCSSTETVGPVMKPYAIEEAEQNPTYEYGRSKQAAEQIIKEYGHKGLNYTIIRPTGVYGPGNINDISYWFITSVAKGEISSKFIVGDGENLIQFVYIDDLLEGFISILEKPEISKGKTYTISDSRAYTYNEIYSIMSSLTGIKPPSLHISKNLAKITVKPIEWIYDIIKKDNFMLRSSTIDVVTSDRAYSIEKVKNELNYMPKYSLFDGLKKTIEWYKAEGYI